MPPYPSFNARHERNRKKRDAERPHQHSPRPIADQTEHNRQHSIYQFRQLLPRLEIVVGQLTGSDILESVQKITARKKSSIKSAIWVSYDLGVQGDYPGIYSWLDEHQAN
jgi:hypothetical protein